MQPPTKSAPDPLEVEQRLPRHSVPTISVTKPPAPLPVDLPTESDIIPSPTTPDSGASSPTDLESGRHHMMREINDRRLASAKVNSPVAAPTPAQPMNEAALIPLPMSPDPDTVSSRSGNPTPSPAASAPLADITDLLDDSAPPALEAAAPIEPSTSPSPSQPAASPSALPEDLAENAAIPDEKVETQEAEAEPDTTIRLIGGGGTTGVTGVDHESTLVDGEDDAAEPEADDEEHSETDNTKDGFEKKHEKKSSSISSGLKKIGNLGGADKRRKDSNTSAKDITV